MKRNIWSDRSDGSRPRTVLGPRPGRGRTTRARSSSREASRPALRPSAKPSAPRSSRNTATFPRGIFVQSLNLDLVKGSRYLRSRREEPRAGRSALSAGVGSHGTFRIDIGYGQTPHRFSFFGATPYVENTPGVFTLNDVIRSAAEALVPTGTSTNIAAARTLVSSFLTSAGPIDLGLRRKKGNARRRLHPDRAVQLQHLGEPRNAEREPAFRRPLGLQQCHRAPRADPLQDDQPRHAASSTTRSGARSGRGRGVFLRQRRPDAASGTTPTGSPIRPTRRPTPRATGRLTAGWPSRPPTTPSSSMSAARSSR